MSGPTTVGAGALGAARDALTLGASLAVTGTLALVIRVLVPRFLGPGAFGEYRLAESAAELLFVVLTFGVDAQMRREAALDPSRARGYLCGLAALRLGLGALGIGATIALLRATGASGHVAAMFVLIAASQVLIVLNNSYAAYEHAAGDVGWIARVNLGAKALWAVAMVAVLVLAPAGIAIALVALGVEALRFTWLTVRGVRRHAWAVRPDVPLAWAAVAASLPFFINAVAHSFYARIGTGWLAAVSTDLEVGLYGAASNLAAIALLGMPLISWVLVPSAARAASRSDEEVGALVSGALRTSLLAMVPVALAFHAGAEFWLRLFFGSAYLPAAPVLRILAPTFVLAYASTVCAIGLIQHGRIWRVAAISMAGIAVTALLDLVLIPWGVRTLGPAGGAQGAAWATLGTEVVVTSALAWSHRSFWRNPALRRTAAALSAGAAASVAAVTLVPSGGVVAMAAAGAVFVVVVVTTRGLDGDDLRFCRRVLARSRPAAPVPVSVEA